MAAPFVASIFASAFLLFLVQPLTARLLLPGFGGSPAVWNTALVFFQTALLVGYAYAYALARLRSVRLQLALHIPVLLLPLFVLPIAVSSAPDPSASPALAMLLTLTAGVGLPFFVLSTNGSLMQHWYGGTAESDSDPYWMYAASNFGSLLALAAFPLAIEPFVGITRQVQGWALGYGLFLALAAWAMVHRARASARVAVEPSVGDLLDGTEPGQAPSIGWGLRLDWIIRAAVGSSLLLAINMKITTDVGPIPLLWVVPLALYLVTFIIAFAYADRMAMRPLVAATIVALCAGLGLDLGGQTFGFKIVLAICLALLFAGALLCHTDLARARPHADKLTEFYLWISAGGAVGGILNSLVAPVVFDTVAEYPLTLAALAWVAFVRPKTDNTQGAARFFKPSPVVALASALALALPFIPRMMRAESAGSLAWLVGAVVLAGIVVAMRRYIGFIAVVPTIVAVLALSGLGEPYPVLAAQRSFFGVSRIWETEDRIVMVHGSTIHGSQLTDSIGRKTTGTYYHTAGPLGSTMLAAPGGSTIGILGLGAGELSALGRPGQHIIFYEIDPVVVDFASRFFTYLDDSPAEVSTVLGDGRLTLAAAAQGSHDVLILDAFSSDNVPTHLLTEEALLLYLEKLAPGGVLVIHTSSRHADLRRVVRGFSEATGLPSLISDFRPDDEQAAEGGARTTAAALANDRTALEILRTTGLWTDMPTDVKSVHWTDDSSSLLQVLGRIP